MADLYHEDASMTQQYERQPCASPNDYRNMSVCPTANDIHGRGDLHLRAIKSVGSYENGYGYLEVNFRLLREDIVSPLREGIQEIISNEVSFRRKQDLKIYHNVEMLTTLCTDGGIIYRIKFDPITSKTKNIPWKSSKKLINQSLLCFSKDDYKTMVFGIVAARDPTSLNEGIFDVKFTEDADGYDYFIKGKKMQMVESPAYYEAYKHVLEGMKEISPLKIPMQKYIVHCQVEVDAPKYTSSGNITPSLSQAFGSMYLTNSLSRSGISKTGSKIRFESCAKQYNGQSGNIPGRVLAFIPKD